MRLALRDYFWLTLVVALSLGWLLDRTHLASDAVKGRKWEELAGKLQETLESLGYETSISEEIDGYSFSVSGPQYSVRGSGRGSGYGQPPFKNLIDRE